MKRSTVILTLTILLALSGVTANASLIGDTVSVNSVTAGMDMQGRETFGIWFGDVPVVVGGPEVAYTAFDQQIGFEDVNIAIDIEAEDVWMTLTVNSDQAWLNFDILLAGLDWVGMPNGELLDISVDSSNAPGFTLFGASVSPHGFDVSFNSLGQPISAGVYSVHVGLITNHGVIPEPATMTLMGLGLAGMALRRRKSA